MQPCPSSGGANLPDASQEGGKSFNNKGWDWKDDLKFLTYDDPMVQSSLLPLIIVFSWFI